MGNITPGSQLQTVDNSMLPFLTELRAGKIPSIEQWYWFRNKGKDPKYKKHSVWTATAGRRPLPSFPLRAYRILTLIAIWPIAYVDFIPSPNALILTNDVLNEFNEQTPPQGLFASDDDGGEGCLLEKAYHNLVKWVDHPTQLIQNLQLGSQVFCETGVAFSPWQHTIGASFEYDDDPDGVCIQSRCAGAHVFLDPPPVGLNSTHWVLGNIKTAGDFSLDFLRPYGKPNPRWAFSALYLVDWMTPQDELLRLVYIPRGSFFGCLDPTLYLGYLRDITFTTYNPFVANSPGFMADRETYDVSGTSEPLLLDVVDTPLLVPLLIEPIYRQFDLSLNPGSVAEGISIAGRALT